MASKKTIHVPKKKLVAGAVGAPPAVVPGVVPDPLPPGAFDPVIDLEEAQAGAAERQALETRCERIVILMMENRSFDHIFGRLGPERGGLTLDERNTVPPNTEGGASFPVHPIQITDIEFDPPHALFRTVRDQVSGGSMGGFVDEFIAKSKSNDWKDADPGLVMGYYPEGALPAYDFLADHHLVFPRYFCSIQTGTWNNRMFLYAGTNNGLVDAKPPIRKYKGQRDQWKERMPKQLLVDLLEEHGVSWAVYADGVAWMRVFPDHDFMGSRTFSIRRFEKDCEDGTLPSVVFIDPNFDPGLNFTANDDHPPIDLLNGQELIARIYNALVPVMNTPNDKTVFVITYDEHGGFYDHVPPPPARGAGWETYFRTNFADPRGDLLRFDPGTPEYDVGVQDYGVRVPCVVVSKWAPGGPDALQSIGDRVVLDHVSLHASIHRKFLPNVPMLGRRVIAAQTLGRLLVLDQPRPSFSPMPALRSRPAPRRRAAPEGPAAQSDDTSFHDELRELTRPKVR
jgi:phospholipase C